MSAEQLKVCFVVNPQSASGRTGQSWERVASELRGLVGSFTVKKTTQAGDGILLTREALHEGHDLVVSVGGDGTNNEVVNGFFLPDGRPVREGAMFSFFASGSGSDLQRTLPTTRNAEELAALILRGSVRHLDVGSLEWTDAAGEKGKRYFLNIASFGMSGLVAQLTNRSRIKRWSAKLAFQWASIRGFFGFPNVSLRIYRDEQPVYEVRSRLGAICNGRCFGSGMRMAPEAEMDDGLLDLILLEGFSLPYLLAKFGTIYKGTHVHLKGVTTHRVRRLRVESDTPNVLMEIDGEELGRLPLVCEVMAGALPFRSLSQEVVKS